MKKFLTISMLILAVSIGNATAQQKKVATVQSLSEEIEQLRLLCGQQQNEIDKLRSENNDFRKRIVGNNSIYSSQDNITELNKSVKELREEFNKVMGTSNSWNQPKIPDLQKRIDELENSVKKLSGSSSSYNQPNISDLSKRLNQLEESVRKLSGSSSSYNQPNLSDLSSRLEKLERRISDVERYERRISDLERKVK